MKKKIELSNSNEYLFCKRTLQVYTKIPWLSNLFFKKNFFLRIQKSKHKPLFCLIFLYLHKMPVTQLIYSTGISSEAVCNRKSYIRQLLVDTV